MAYRAGASVDHLAFIQFHPTALATDAVRPFLISEAVRGVGAVLKFDQEGLSQWNKAMEEARKKGEEEPPPDSYSFTLKYTPEGSMATRDIVARAIDQQMKKHGTNHVYLITSHLDEALDEKIPNHRSSLSNRGIETRRGPHPGGARRPLHGRWNPS